MGFEVYRMKNINDDHIIPSEVEGLIFFFTTEDRSCNLLDQLSEKKKIPSQIMLLSFEEFNEDFLKSLNEKYNSEIISFQIELDLSGDLLPCFRAIDQYVNSKKTIGIDISCMQIPVFTRIIHFMYSRYKEKKLIVYYTEPGYYNLDNLFDYAAYSGEIDIKAIPGYEGETSRKEEVRRIVLYLMGFEKNYLSKLIPQETNPDGVVPINGFPSYFPKYKDISLINNNYNFHEHDIEIIFTEANNPFETYNQLVSLKNKNHDYCIDILAAGSKPMALGACLFALKNGNNSVRLLFPFPSEYKHKQSTGIGPVWEYVI